MRELDECTAEVFRRGEQRIRERRRKRIRILAVCIPICLIIAVWPAMNRPEMAQAGLTGDSAQAAEEMSGSAPESAACPYAAVEIQSAGGITPERYGEVTDRLAVAEMFEAVSSLFADASENLPSGGDFSAEIFPTEIFPTEETDTNQAQSESAGTWNGYRITFTAEDGSQAVYHLGENTLVNVSKHEKVFLNDAQTAGLLAALGLAE